MNYSRTLILAIALGGLAACQPKAGTPTAAVDNSAPIATVNGTAITQDFFDYYIKGITGKPANVLTPDHRTQALDNLIRAHLVAQQAQKYGGDKNTDTAAMIERPGFNV